MSCVSRWKHNGLHTIQVGVGGGDPPVIFEGLFDRDADKLYEALRTAEANGGEHVRYDFLKLLGFDHDTALGAAKRKMK